MTLASAGLKRGEESSGRKASCPDPDSRRRRVLKKSRLLVKQICHKRRSPLRVPEKPSAFHRLAQRTASRLRDARQQSRLFARWNQSLGRGMLTKFSVRQVLEPEEKKPSSVSSRFDLIPIYGVGEVLTAPRQRADKYIFPYKWKSHLRIDEVHRHLDAPKK
jgi:hypothetical protein